MRTFQWIFGLLLSLTLAACGGGGGGSGGGGGGGGGSSISVSPTSVSFNVTEGAPTPAATTVHVNFVGDGVVVGYAPGVPQPSWLNVAQQGAATTTSADFSLNVLDTSTPGTRSTSVRFIAGKADGSDIKTFDLPVTYTVTASDLSIAASAASFSYVAAPQGTLPATQNLTITTNGDNVTVTGVPSWLTLVPPASPFASPAVYGLKVNSSGFTAGTVMAADIRFTATRSGSNAQRNTTVHVTYDIVQPFDATASAANMGFTAVTKSTQLGQPTAGYTIAIVGTRPRWRASADQPWIKLSAASGTGAANVVVTADASTQGRGTFTGHVTINDDDSGQARTFTATLVSRAPNLTVTPNTLSFSVDTLTPASALSKSFTVSDELNGTQPSEAVTWSVQSVSATWLQWAPMSGTSSPSPTGTVSLKSAEIEKFVPGHYSATVTIQATTAAGTSQTLTVPIELEYQPAYVSFVGSYIGLANQAGTLYVRGTNFSKSGGTVSVTIGSTEIAAVVPDGDTQVRVSYPALPAGRYPVAIKNVTGLAATNAELVVLAPPALTYQAINAPTPRSRVVYDAERETLYAVNLLDQSIEKYTRVGGVWTAGTTYIVPDLTDIALAPDGRSLIVVQKTTMNDISLTSGPFIAQPRNTFSDTFCGGYMDSLSIGNDGKAFVITNLAGCSGYTSSYLYDIRSHELKQNTGGFDGSLYNGIVAGSADGSKLYAGSNGLSPAPEVKIVNTLDGSITNSNVNFNLNAVTVSGNASRVILQNVDVYSGALSLTGHLPAGQGVVLASRDSSRAYVYRDDVVGGGPRLDIYNLNGTLQAGAIYPLLKTVALTDAPNSTTGHYFAITMAETPDGNTVFVSGESRIVVQPVN